MLEIMLIILIIGNISRIILAGKPFDQHTPKQQQTFMIYYNKDCAKRAKKGQPPLQPEEYIVLFKKQSIKSLIISIVAVVLLEALAWTTVYSSFFNR